MHRKRFGEWSDADVWHVALPASGWAALFVFFAAAGSAAHHEPAQLAEARSSVSTTIGVDARFASSDGAARAADAGFRDAAVNTVAAPVSTHESVHRVGAGDTASR